VSSGKKIKVQESILDPYRQIIDDLLPEDDYQATWVLEPITKMGYPGSYEPVRDYERSVKVSRCRLAYALFATELRFAGPIRLG
jgi:hypothetical protein